MAEQPSQDARGVELTALGRSYGSFEAVHPLSLRIEPGETFGLLGIAAGGPVRRQSAPRAAR